MKGGLAGSVPDPTAPWTKLNDFGVDGSGTTSGFATHRTFEVDVADNPSTIISGQPIGLDCVGGNETSQIDQANITVTYYPRSYEPISLTPLP